MNQFLPNIPYENLPVEVIRYLCEKGVRGMHEYGLMDEIEDAKVANLLKDFDLSRVSIQGNQRLQDKELLEAVPQQPRSSHDPD